MRIRVLLIAVVFAAAALAGRAQSKAPITHEALWLLPRVGAPVTSPDGKWVAFSVTEPAYNPDDQRSDLWMVPADGSAERLSRGQYIPTGVSPNVLMRPTAPSRMRSSAYECGGISSANRPARRDLNASSIPRQGSS